MILKPVERRIGLAAFYNAVYAPRGFALAAHHYPIISGLEDHRIDNLLVLGPPGLGKSNILSSVYPAWELGHDPTLTVLAVSAGEKLPQGFMAATMQIIQHDRTWAKLFPEVQPQAHMGWSMSRGLFVTGHHMSDPDASFTAVGVASKALTGLHARLHIYDDIHDRENASTPEGRAMIRAINYDTLVGRADPRGARRVAAGRWWADDDIYQEWIQSGDWVVLQLPAARPGNMRLWYDVFVPRPLIKAGGCVFSETLQPEPERLQDPGSQYIRYRAPYGAIDTLRQGFYWPDSPSKRKEYLSVRRRQPRVAAVNYDGDMRAGLDAVFVEEDFVPYDPPCDLSLGRSAPGFDQWFASCGGAQLKQAWDTAFGQPKSESNTVSLTGLFVPCNQWHCGEDSDIVGPCDFHFDILLLDAVVRSVDFRGLTMLFRSQYSFWHPNEVIVEEKQSGISLVQAFRASDIPVRGQKIEQGKVERAINPVTREVGSPVGGGAASVQGWGRMGRIRYPRYAPWVLQGPDGDQANGFFKRVIAFTGGVRNSDEFDALVHLVTRAIVMSRTRGLIGKVSTEDTALDTIGAAQALHDPRRQAMEAFGLMTDPAWHDTGNPWANMCGAPCEHFKIQNNQEHCALHDRRTSAISGCAYWAPKKHAAFV